jgi:hypothetical protein
MPALLLVCGCGLDWMLSFCVVDMGTKFWFI